LSHAASFHSNERIAPSNRGIKHLAIIRRIDELHLLYTFADSRMLRDLPRQEGTAVGWLHVATLMKRMPIEAIYSRPNTSKPAPGHKVYPYLLRKLAVIRPTQVWVTDITYVPMARSFVYVVAIVDWFNPECAGVTGVDLADAGFCIEALKDAPARYGKPPIFNSDQGSQFTSTAFTAVLHREQIAIGMNERGCWCDNVFVERFWLSVK
jgi:putative transposase